MSNIFNFSRFGKLFVKHTNEHYRGYLMSAMVLSGILALFYGFVTLADGKLNPSVRVSALTILYLAAGCIFTSTIFSEYGHKNRAIVALTLPASHLEKFMVAWFYTYVIYTLIFIICFWLVDSIYMQFANQWDTEKNLLDVLPGNRFLMILFSMYTMLHGIVLLGAIYFKGAHFVKTALSFFVGLGLLCLFHFRLLQAILPVEKVMFSPPFMNGLAILSDSKKIEVVRINNLEVEIYTWILLVGFTAALWVASFLQLKEKQI